MNTENRRTVFVLPIQDDEEAAELRFLVPGYIPSMAPGVAVWIGKHDCADEHKVAYVELWPHMDMMEVYLEEQTCGTMGRTPSDKLSSVDSVIEAYLASAKECPVEVGMRYEP